MNTYGMLHGRQARASNWCAGCGRTAIENRARAFWQSRDPKRRLPDLADLASLARKIRNASRH